MDGVSHCRWPTVLPTELPAWKQTVDLLLRVGPRRLVHVEQIVEEIGMTAESIAEFYPDTVWGRVLQDVGREEGVQQMLADLLGDRFGPDPAVTETAERLVTWPHGAVHAVTSAATLGEVARAEPPRTSP